MAATQHFQIYLQPEPEGGYTVMVPALPGCVTYGKTVEEAKAMAADAIQGYIASMAKHGESPVVEDHGFLTAVDVSANG
jgi:antitoxin HicB